MAWNWRPWNRGPRDPVKEQLRAIAKQGGSEAAMNHVVSYALIIAFSIGSLITLAGDALNNVLQHTAEHQLDLPNLVSLIVSFLVVIGMDLAMLWAARVITQRNERRNGEGVFRHQAMLIFCAATESLTYLYMSIKFDHPAAFSVASVGAALTTGVVWFILALRAFGAPVVAIYLNMGRPLPVGAEDMLLEMARATGEGAINQMVRIGRDPDAPLERIMALWRSADVVSPKLDARIQRLLDSERDTRDLASITGMTPQALAQVKEQAQAKALPAPATSTPTPSTDTPATVSRAVREARQVLNEMDDADYEDYLATMPRQGAVKGALIPTRHAGDWDGDANSDDDDDSDGDDFDPGPSGGRRGKHDARTGYAKNAGKSGIYQASRNGHQARASVAIRDDVDELATIERERRRKAAKKARQTRAAHLSMQRDARIESIARELAEEDAQADATALMRAVSASPELGMVRRSKADRIIRRAQEEVNPAVWGRGIRAIYSANARDAASFNDDESGEESGELAAQ